MVYYECLAQKHKNYWHTEQNLNADFFERLYALLMETNEVTGCFKCGDIFLHFLSRIVKEHSEGSQGLKT